MRTRLTKRQVREIYLAEGPLQSISWVYEVSASHVGYIKRGMIHASVTGASPAPRSKRVLSPELIARVAAHTGTLVAAAKELGVSVATIKKYRGRTGRRIQKLLRDNAGRFVQ